MGWEVHLGDTMLCIGVSGYEESSTLKLRHDKGHAAPRSHGHTASILALPQRLGIPSPRSKHCSKYTGESDFADGHGQEASTTITGEQRDADASRRDDEADEKAL